MDPTNEPAASEGQGRADFAYETILAWIVNGALKPGTVIQERSLSDRLSVSRTPLREALKRLESEGVLTRTGNRYLQVKVITAKDYSDNFQLRKLLEAHAIDLATGHLDPDMLDDLARRTRAQLDSSAEDAEDELRLDTELHEAIAGATGNALLLSFIQTLRRQQHLYDSRRMRARAQESADEHLRLLAALKAEDAEAAKAVMAEHLSNTHSFFFRNLMQ